ncbi:MAG: diacylglycerol kinase family protein [Prevotellaceae bacterium]|jgi:diacylglycerol kinase (ATP)|nr:diacylglycerol kinase family protein [Prevotellaceae bacterium]
MRYDIKKQLKSFRYAWCGLKECARKEQNMCFHLVAAVLVVAVGAAFRITRTEWMLAVLCIGLVVAAELVNTAIESVVDLASPERHPLAARAKDVAAAAVLVCAVTAAVVGLIIFVPYLVKLF